MSSPVQCLASEIAGLLQDHQARLKTPKASQIRLESYSRTLPQHISAALRHKKKNGVCSGFWSWDLLILERASLWHCLWCQLQCICHQVYRFLNLPSSVWWHKNAQVHATLPIRSAMCSELPTSTFLFPSNWENKSINASMHTEQWCKITQNTAPRLASSPRQTHICNATGGWQPRGRLYNEVSPTTPGAWVLLLSGTKKQNSA